MKRFVLILLLIVAAVVMAPFLLEPDVPAPALQDLPWRIEVHADGSSTVFGVRLGHSTLADAQARFGEEMELAVIAAPGEAGDLEAYIGRFTAGVLTGKLVLSADLPDDSIRALRRGAASASPTATGALKFRLAQADLQTALRASISVVTFIPSVHIDPDTAERRFGPPAERISDTNGAEHWLYPDRGLDLILHPEQKEVLQYVAPKAFETLTRPLRAAASGSP